MTLLAQFVWREGNDKKGCSCKYRIDICIDTSTRNPVCALLSILGTPD